MRIDYEFTVGVPVDLAWDRLLDLEKIAPCLPGAAIQERIGDGEYAGTIRVKIGPISVSYKGTVAFEETDASDRRAVIRATGREARGQGTATATIVSTLRDEDGGTRVEVETDMRLTGRVAQFGRGMAQSVAREMLDEFAACLEREISGETGDGSRAPESEAAAEAVAGSSAGGAGKASSAATAATGGTVEGAIVAGSSPSEAAAGAPTTPVQQPKIQTIPSRGPREEAGSPDPGVAEEGANLKRLTPVLAGVGVLLVLFWRFRRRS